MRTLTMTELACVQGAGFFSWVENAWDDVKNFVDGSDAAQHPCGTGAFVRSGTIGATMGFAKSAASAAGVEIVGLGPEDIAADAVAGLFLEEGATKGVAVAESKQAYACYKSK